MLFKKPRILLIGAGTFGVKHLETLLRLQRKGVLTIAGVVVSTKRSQQRLRQVYAVPVFRSFSTEMFTDVDAVDVVTPPETHASYIQQCLPKVHVFVEKPLALGTDEASAIVKQAHVSSNVLMVGHVFRFHPVIIRLRKILRVVQERPHTIKIEFINPIATDKGRDIELEILHPFDIIDYLLEKPPTAKHVESKGRCKVVSLVYRGGTRALLKLGWSGNEKKRSVELFFKRKRIVCNLTECTIEMYADGLAEKRISCRGAREPLEAELRSFVRAIRVHKALYTDAVLGRRIVEIASMRHMELPSTLSRKKVAVIGAGIFGTNCAIELASRHNVVVFEKNKNILSEASFINQYRHHAGFHYPRSQETVNDISRATADFESRYKKAIITNFPTYYSVAKKNSRVSSKQYIEFCDRNNLQYTREYPSDRLLDKKKVSVCLKTYEPIYDYVRMRDITTKLLRENRIGLRLQSEVVGARVMEDGRKKLYIRKKDGTVSEECFDYVINVTYARYNNFCSWLGFPRKPLRIDLVETLWVKLPMPKVSLAVMDGMFTNLVPTGEDNIFTLVHIKESVLRRFVPASGLVPRDIFTSIRHSRAEKIISYSTEWFPVLKEAKIVRAYYVLRGVNAYREYDDARMSDVTEHGFGCFSVLGGKIINAVSVAKQIARLVEKD